MGDELDGCTVLWDASTLDDELDRDYLVAGLDLGVTSPPVGDIGRVLATTLTTLENTLNTTLASPIEGDTLTAVTNLLGTVLGGLAGIGLGNNPVTIELDGEVDLDPVRDLLTEDLTDGVVTVNLSTGEVRADLALLVGESYGDGDGLNGRDPNTSVLQPDVINALLARIATLVNDFVANDLEQALLATLYATTVTVDIAAKVDLTVLGVTVASIADLTIGLDLSIGALLGKDGYPANPPAVDLKLLPLTPVLSWLLSGLTDLVLGLISPLTNAIITDLIPGLGSILIEPLVGTVTSTLATVVGTTLPPLIEALRPVFELLALVLKLTLNAQPDQPGSVGAPTAAPPGRYFVSALHVQVVGDEASVLDLWAASSSVGPATSR